MAKTRSSCGCRSQVGRVRAMSSLMSSPTGIYPSVFSIYRDFPAAFRCFAKTQPREDLPPSWCGGWWSTGGGARLPGSDRLLGIVAQGAARCSAVLPGRPSSETTCHMRWCAHGITQTACGGGAMWRAPNGGSARRRGSHDQVAVEQCAHAVPPTACADCSVRCGDEPCGLERCTHATSVAKV